jgi:iron(III) transport system substrate-binding protein
VRATRAILVVSLLVAVMAGCGGGTSGGSAKSMTLYTCARANVEQAVITGFKAAHSGTEVKVLRAPTGQLNARVAAGSPIASPDWAAMSGGYRSMLAEYAKIFGG